MVYAFTVGPGTFDPAKFASLSTIINVILPTLNIGAAVIFLAMGLYAAFTWITAGGNQENLTKASKIFTSAIIGLIIVFFSFFIIKLIGIVLKVNIPVN